MPLGDVCFDTEAAEALLETLILHLQAWLGAALWGAPSTSGLRGGALTLAALRQRELLDMLEPPALPADSPELPAVPAEGAEMLGEVDVAGLQFQRAKDVEGVRLRARGVSHLTQWGFQVCAAVLYLPDGARADTGAEVMAPGQAKQLELRYMRTITGDQFRMLTRWSISRNDLLSQEAEQGLIQFNPLYQTVGPGDCYTLTYQPDLQQVDLALNGESLGSVKGGVFSEALFSVWFGAYPFFDQFKHDILKKGELP